MRTVFVCMGCVAQYLPPESMTYPSLPGLKASPVHCGNPACRSAVEDSLAVTGMPQDELARLARRAAGLEGPVRKGRPGRRSRGRRPAAAPASARSRLL